MWTFLYFRKIFRKEDCRSDFSHWLLSTLKDRGVKPAVTQAVHHWTHQGWTDRHWAGKAKAKAGRWVQNPLMASTTTGSPPRALSNSCTREPLVSILLIFTCVSVLPACLHGCLVTKETRSIRIPGNDIMDCGEPPCGYWEPNPGPPQEQNVLLTLSHLSNP